MAKRGRRRLRSTVSTAPVTPLTPEPQPVLANMTLSEEGEDNKDQVIYGMADALK